MTHCGMAWGPFTALARHLAVLLVLGLPVQTTAAEIGDLFRSMVFLRQVRTNLNITPKETNEVWLKSVFTGELKPQTSVSSGSGSLFVFSNRLYLVTARHVATSMGLSSEMVLGESKRPVVRSLARLSRVSNQIPWIHHKAADVSILRLLPSDQDLDDLFRVWSLPATILATHAVSPPRDVPLTVFGFPFGLGVYPEHSPISRASRCASGLVEMPEDSASQRPRRTIFFLEDPSISGFSGAPVVHLNAPLRGPGYTLGSGPATCYGFVSATVSDETGGKLAEIVPSSQVFELLVSDLSASPN